jgi:hypothetical protein
LVGAAKGYDVVGSSNAFAIWGGQIPINRLAALDVPHASMNIHYAEDLFNCRKAKSGVWLMSTGRESGVPDDDQHSVGYHRGCGHAQDAVSQVECLEWGVEVLRANEVEAAYWERVGEIVELPGDSPSETSGIGMAGASVEGSRGDVDSGDLPASLGQPDGVSPLTATEVESAPWGERLCFTDE